MLLMLSQSLTSCLFVFLHFYQSCSQDNKISQLLQGIAHLVKPVPCSEYFRFCWVDIKTNRFWDLVQGSCLFFASAHVHVKAEPGHLRSPERPLYCVFSASRIVNVIGTFFFFCECSFNFNNFLYLQIHLSFSLQGMGSSESAQSMIFGVFLQSVGVVLTDVQDVLFK